MVTKHQVIRLRRAIDEGKDLRTAALLSAMCTKTARKWLRRSDFPGDLREMRTYRTRKDPFEEVWPEIEALLRESPDIQATVIFSELCRKYPGRFKEGQLRTLQRRVRLWRATEGPEKEIFFPQEHEPGSFCQSDFTSLNSLGVTIRGKPLKHLFFHFVLPYSNWETGQICFSENFETLSSCFQDCVWELGGVPRFHQHDRTSAAVSIRRGSKPVVYYRYRALLEHYGMEYRLINTASPHEDGDVEQAHYRLKSDIKQALILRGSKDFWSLDRYKAFLRLVIRKRQERVREKFLYEKRFLRALPPSRLQWWAWEEVTVSKFSTINVRGNVYSVRPQLRGQKLKVKICPDRIILYLGTKQIDSYRRLQGRGQCFIDWRHVISGLLKKPRAFRLYRWREELFPTEKFSLLYNLLKKHCPQEADLTYLRILNLAKQNGLKKVEHALKPFLDKQKAPAYEELKALVEEKPHEVPQLELDPVDLSQYDSLLEGGNEDGGS